MIYLLVVACFLALLHREIFFGLLYAVLTPDRIRNGPWDLKVRSQTKLKKAPALYLTKHAGFDTVIVDHFGRHGSVFVQENLWNLWNEKEKEAFFLWSYYALYRQSSLQRFVFSFDAFTTDRDYFIFSKDLTDLESALLKNLEFREKHPLGWLASWLQPLSFLGGSYIWNQPPLIKNRLQRLDFYIRTLSA